MRSKLLTTCACVSAICCIGFLSLYLYAQIFDPQTNITKSSISCPHISLGNSVNATVIKDQGGFIVFFNESVPYTGSIIGPGGDKGVTETGWGSCGIAFEEIKYAVDNHIYWTLMISIWHPIIVSFIFLIVCVVQKLRRTKPKAHPEGPKT
jgi:hypothetical protein